MFFSLLRTIFDGIKVVPLTTLTVLRICHMHARFDIITYPIPCNGYNFSLVFPHFFNSFINIQKYLWWDIIKLKLRCFKSSEHINEKGNGPYRGFDYFKKSRR